MHLKVLLFTVQLYFTTKIFYLVLGSHFNDHFINKR
jgi:hypothetical protein